MGCIPEDSLNTNPYMKRGWCFYETSVASVGAASFVSILDGSKRFDMKSPVPLPPSKFAAKIKELTFTNGADQDVVIQLYEKVFPKVAATGKLEVWAWQDEDVEELLTEIQELKRLNRVYIFNKEAQESDPGFVGVSEEVKRKLHVELERRGGRGLCYSAVWPGGCLRFGEGTFTSSKKHRKH